MKTKVLTVLAIAAVITGLGNRVQAQSSVPNSNTGYTLSGDSLREVNRRAAEEDYSQFFSVNDSRNTVGTNNNTGTFAEPGTSGLQINDDLELYVNRRLTAPRNPILNPRPEQQFEGLDRLEVQLDLTDE
ncbi:MAG: hypothetical protein SAK29_21745 [Scytonema sp. PMC 1069.18]|nr:hypothetical protein [Scytonema sp. PMC 1069.18]MEC4887538.1 hypothetical protein [Scytonema sp. PMC 1070.18]